MQIDTLHVEFYVDLDLDQLGFDWKKTTEKLPQRPFGFRERVKFETSIKVGFSNIVIRYYPNENSDKPRLIVEISSIPKIINRTNAEPLDDIQLAYNKINEAINSIAGVQTPLDIREGRVLRIDINHDYYVGGEIQDYLHVISQLIYPYREKVIYVNQNSKNLCNGIWFKTKKCSSVKFYDKGVETGNHQFYGLLRQESCIKGPKSLEKAFGSPHPRLCDITEGMQLAVLINDLVILGLDHSTPADQDVVKKTLKAHFGIADTIRLKATIETLEKHKELNLPVICNELGIKKSTFYKRIKQIKSAGLVPAQNGGENTLKPLVDHLWSDIFPKKHV